MATRRIIGFYLFTQLHYEWRVLYHSLVLVVGFSNDGRGGISSPLQSIEPT